MKSTKQLNKMHCLSSQLKCKQSHFCGMDLSLIRNF